jgi:hypothetical protein
MKQLTWCPSTGSNSVLLFQTAAKISDKAGQITVIWCRAKELLTVFESRTNITGITIEGQKSEQGVTIVRVPDQTLL